MSNSEPDDALPAEGSASPPPGPASPTPAASVPESTPSTPEPAPSLNAPRSWRSARHPAPHTAPVPAWRSAAKELPAQQIDRRRFRRAATTLICFGVAIGLFGFLVYDLVFYPRMVPFVALNVTEYRSPLPPNGWAQEDLERLKSPDVGLHQKTLVVYDLSMELRNRDRARQSLAAALKRGRANAVHSGGLIVSISMHGMVDDDGNVGLLLPDADLVQSQTWWPLQEVFAEIKSLELPERTLKLVILDCNRLLTEWSAGVACNHVADRLEAEVQRARIPNLVVLNSTSPGEVAWQSRDLHGSVFGQFLRIGLSGAADRVRTGNRNRKITLRELHSYLVESVDQWAWANRRSRQRPMLIPADAADRSLVWTLGRSNFDAVIAETQNQALPVPSVSIDALSRLWYDFNELQQNGKLRTDPLLGAELTRKLLWLESALLAGSAYADDARDTQRDLEETFSQLAQQPGTAAALYQSVVGTTPASGAGGQAGSLLNSLTGALTGGATGGGLQPAFNLHSLPLALKFQSSSTSNLSLVETELQQVIAAPSLQGVQSTVARLSAVPAAAALAEVHFLRLLSQYIPQLGTASLEQLPGFIRLQMRAEQAAAPKDVRHQTWLQPLMDVADKQRRAAFDLWAAGQFDPQALAAAERAYAALERLEQDLATAYQLSDEVTAELPWLAQWITRPTAFEGQSEDDAENVISNTWPQLLAALQALNQRLVSATGADRVDELMESSPFLADVDAVSRSYRPIRQQIDAEYARLLESAEDPVQRLADIIALMNSPLLPKRESINGLAPFAQRSSLQQLSLQLSTELQSQTPAFAFVTPGSKRLPPVVVNYEAVVRGWNPHPLLSLLPKANGNAAAGNGGGEAGETVHGASSSNGNVANLDALTLIGRETRRRLAAYPVQIDLSQRAALADQKSPRPRLAENDQQTRMAATLLSQPMITDPAQTLLRFDIQQLVLLSAKRRLDDFWGLTPAAPTPWFSTAVEADLGLARQLLPPGPFAQTQSSQLRRLLETRQQAAGQGLKVDANDVLLLEPLPSIPAQVTIARNPSLAADALPAGTASAQLRPSATAAPIARQSLTLPLDAGKTTPGTKTLDFSLSPAQLGETQLVWDALVSYRGHEFRSGFLAHLPQGSVVDFEPLRPRSASVLVSGGPVMRESILFILDCSHSMSEKARSEGPGDPPTRMAAASTALVNMLNRLSVRKDVQVGVVFFGHRVGWNTKQTGQLLPQVNYGRPIPAGLQPYEDVEVVLPLGRFDPSWEQSIAMLLKTVQPWGETPLYLSLIRALPLFNSQTEREAQSIVVITDGVNYQFNPTAAANKQLSDATAALTGKSVAVHIVGFGIDDRDAPTAQREFESIARLTKGSYTTVDHATALVETLENILSVQQFSVTPPTSGSFPSAAVGRGSLPATQTSDVGRPIVISDAFRNPMSLLTRLGSAQLPIELDGGEGLELQPSPDGRTLRSARYTRNLMQTAPLTGGPASAAWELGIHHPFRQDDGVLFEFSVQDAQQEYLRRPRGLWLTVTPHPSQPGTQPYVFYDAEYLPDTPVPVVRWPAQHWPTDRQQARVEVWVRDQLPEPVGSFPVTDQLNTAIRNGTTLNVPTIANVQLDLRVRPGDVDRIDVIERHADAITAADLLHVRLQTDRTIERIVRRFDLAQKVAVHVFLLSHDERNVSERLGNTSIEIRTHRSFAAGAWQLPEPALVDIPADHGLVRPTVPTP